MDSLLFKFCDRRDKRGQLFELFKVLRVPKKLKGRLFNLTIRFLILMESMTDIQESQEGLPRILFIFLLLTV